MEYEKIIAELNTSFSDNNVCNTTYSARGLKDRTTNFNTDKDGSFYVEFVGTQKDKHPDGIPKKQIVMDIERVETGPTDFQMTLEIKKKIIVIDSQWGKTKEYHREDIKKVEKIAKKYNWKIKYSRYSPD